MRGRPRGLCLDILAERREDSEMVRPDRLWRNARLATMTGDGLGVVEGGVVAATDGRIAYAGPADGAPSDAVEAVDCDGRWIKPGLIDRTEERRVGKECVRKCKSRWWA